MIIQSLSLGFDLPKAWDPGVSPRLLFSPSYFSFLLPLLQVHSLHLSECFQDISDYRYLLFLCKFWTHWLGTLGSCSLSIKSEICGYSLNSLLRHKAPQTYYQMFPGFLKSTSTSKISSISSPSCIIYYNWSHSEWKICYLHLSHTFLLFISITELLILLFLNISSFNLFFLSLLHLSITICHMKNCNTFLEESLSLFSIL